MLTLKEKSIIISVRIELAMLYIQRNNPFALAKKSSLDWEHKIAMIGVP